MILTNINLDHPKCQPCRLSSLPTAANSGVHLSTTASHATTFISSTDSSYASRFTEHFFSSPQLAPIMIQFLTAGAE